MSEEEGIQAEDDEPGRSSSPIGDDHPAAADRAEPGAAAPAANQGKNEPIPASREESGQPAPDGD